MATDFSDTGAFNVNGQWATSVRYVAAVEQGRVVGVELRFANGRSELARANVMADEARELLGETNYAVILKAAANAPAIQEDRPGEPLKGELRGKALAFRQVTLSDYEPTPNENAIYLDSRARAAPASSPAFDGEAHEDRLTVRDVVVGGAHLVQAAGAGDSPVETIAQVIGAADAAKLGIDAARGKDVRPLEAATAAASIANASGLGGAGVRNTAAAVQAVGAAETAARALRSLDDVAATGKESPGQSDAAEIEEHLRLRRMRTAAVPDAVAERFLKVQDKYYFPDRTLAFTDKGTKLKAESNNLEVVRTLITIAESRDWQSVTVTGTGEFRKAVWREAALRGIDVRGYEPSDLERQELQRALERKFGPNEITREAPQRATADPGREAGAPAQAKSAGTSQPSQDQRSEDVRDGIRAGVTLGTLMEHGAASYKFDQNNDLSYYVKVMTDRGERTLWGVDLERAMIESKTGVRTGDLVGVENLGKKPVTVKVQKRDAQGRTVVEEINTHRKAWLVEKKAFFQQQAAKADAVRGTDRAQRADLVKQHPDLTDTVVSLWLSEQFAKRSFSRPEDQASAISYAKERLAQMVERGEEISAPKLRQEVAQLLDGGKPSGGAPTPRELAATLHVDERPADLKGARHNDRVQAPRDRLPEVPQHVR